VLVQAAQGFVAVGRLEDAGVAERAQRMDHDQAVGGMVFDDENVGQIHAYPWAAGSA